MKFERNCPTNLIWLNLAKLTSRNSQIRTCLLMSTLRSNIKNCQKKKSDVRPELAIWRSRDFPEGTFKVLTNLLIQQLRSFFCYLLCMIMFSLDTTYIMKVRHVCSRIFRACGLLAWSDLSWNPRALMFWAGEHWKLKRCERKSGK